MTDLTPIECEARLMGLSKVDRKDGEWTQLTLQIHPNDTPYALFLLPLKTHVMLSIKGTEEEPVTAPEAPAETERPKGGERAKRAGILCGNRSFQNWFLNLPGDTRTMPDDWTDEQVASNSIRWRCGVKSRAELDHNEGAARIFDGIVNDFYAAQRGDTSEARQTQLNAGPR